MKFRLALILMAAALLLGSCANDYKKVVVNSCKIPGFPEFGLKQGRMHAMVGVEMDIDNPSGSKFEITGANAVIFNGDGTEFGSVTAEGPVIIKPGKRQTLTVNMDLAVNDPLSLLLGGLPSIDDKTADLIISAKQNGIGPKKIEWKKQPLKALVKQFNFKLQ